MDSASKIPALVASTTDTYCCSIAESRRRSRALQDVELNPDSQGPTATSPVANADETNYFKSAQWSADGTTLITSSADNTFRTFILPPALLSSPSLIDLIPYTSHNSPTPVNCFALYPNFSLQDTSTTVYLSTPSDLPIRLQNCLSIATAPFSTYNLISPTTEAYLTPSSILWSAPGTHFLTGTDCLIALFDVSRSGEGPVIRLPTIPSKRHKIKGGGVGIRGIISSLSHQLSSTEHSKGMLAAGTWTRWIGLYDMSGLGGMVSAWSIADAADKDAGIGGMGISQTLWSSCGRYLCVVERKSNGVLIYDIRVTGKLVAWLKGRKADTNQRLGVDVFQAEKGMEVWAGGVDGVVRVWEEVGKSEGAIERTWEWGAHNDPVSSTMMHFSGTVVATCSGQRLMTDFEDNESSKEDKKPDGAAAQEFSVDYNVETHSHLKYNKGVSRTPDNSIKVWSL